MSIIERIYFELENQDLKASALCAYVGISTAQLSTWKKRGTDPKAIYIPKIAEFLNKSQNYILIFLWIDMKLKLITLQRS